MATTQIKRLYQNGTEFVPITLSEAVVVNTDNLDLVNGLGITTLDKVLSVVLSNVDGTLADITTLENAVSLINELLKNKQDKLTPGPGISIIDGVISVTVGGSLGLYLIISGLLPEPSLEYLNKIILHPNTNGTAGNVYLELLCVELNGSYHWETLGSFQTTVDLAEYVKQEVYQEKVQELEASISTLTTAVNSKVSAQNVRVNNLNVVVNYTFTDLELYGSMLSNT